jgi:hypothetical protein
VTSVDAVNSFQDCEHEVLAMVWPEGMPTSDRLIFDAATDDQRRQVLKRLEAVWRADKGEPLAKLAELAGLKRAAFFNLRKAWRRHSLAGLVPHETRPGRRVSAKAEDPLRKRAAELLRREVGARNVDIAKLMLDEDKDHLLLPDDAATTRARKIVLQSLERLVQHERHGLSLDKDFLRAAYGRGLVLDLTAVSIVVDSVIPSLAVVALLVETASGVIFGSALGKGKDTDQLQQKALASGEEFLKDHRADLVISRSKPVDLAMMLPPDANAVGVKELLSPFVDNLVIGPRIGRIAMAPRRTLDLDVDVFVERRVAPLMKLKEAQAVWNREVERHNADRVVALKDIGLVNGDGVTQGRMAKVIQAVAQALSPAQLSSPAR